MAKKELYILLDSVRSLYNVGSILRISEAIGVRKVFLGGISGIERIGEKIQLHPRLKKTALVGIDIDWEYVEYPIEKLKELKSKGIQIVSLELTSQSIDYTKATYKFPLCLVVGHERLGVGSEISKFSDQIIFIPMHGKGKSLNVSVAAAVALFHLRDKV